MTPVSQNKDILELKRSKPSSLWASHNISLEMKHPSSLRMVRKPLLKMLLPGLVLSSCTSAVDTSNPTSDPIVGSWRQMVVYDNERVFTFAITSPTGTVAIHYYDYSSGHAQVGEGELEGNLTS